MFFDLDRTFDDLHLQCASLAPVAVLVGAGKRLRGISPSGVESFVLGYQLRDHLSS